MISRLRRMIKVSCIYSLVAVQVLFLSPAFSLSVYAQESQPAEGSSSTEPVEPPCVAPPEVRRPTGSASHTYKFNCDSGLWENNYYSWNPKTSYTVAKYTPEHKLNPNTGNFDIYEWVYSAPKGKYVYIVTASYSPAPIKEEPESPKPADTDSINPEQQSSQVQPASVTQNTPNNVKNNDNKKPEVKFYDSDYLTEVDLNVYVDVTNNINSSAVSGNANVLQNTTAGDATSGDALAMANIMNMIQSVYGVGGILPTVHIANIQGDYVGDITIDPSALAGVNPDPGCNCDIDVNVNFDASIENNVDLLAKSGNATVSSNTLAGSATTGDATAVANIINLISSSIAASESFIGILNVHGNLEGDVLVADNVIDQLIAANIPTVDIGLCGCDLDADFSNNFGIHNNINATAASGSATVANNTNAGNATSGSASTNVTVFNLTGRQVVGQDALLVFVNVAGDWVGFITDAPAGATSALIGGGISSSTGNTDIEANMNAEIKNNVNVAAQSGDAEVSYNTNAGDATTGNATANVNIANIVNSNFSLSGWFGLLFINIFGDWHGSFGTNTPYGNTSAAPIPVVVPPININSPASGIISSTNGPTSQRVRAFAVSLGTSEDSEEKTVLTSAKEIRPNSFPLPEENFGAPDSGNNDYTYLALFGALFVAYILIFRNDWITSLLRRN